jgi:hypothetical protein
MQQHMGVSTLFQVLITTPVVVHVLPARCTCTAQQWYSTAVVAASSHTIYYISAGNIVLHP